MSARLVPLLVAACLGAFCLTGCDRSPQPAATSQTAIVPTLWKEFSGEKAFAHVRAQVEVGPRPSGTAPLETARGLITQALTEAGWEVERQEFDAAPVPGQAPIRFVNLLARFSTQKGTAPKRDTQKVILGSHYDTKRMPEIRFVGANDAGSSTGALLELARVAAKSPAFAEQLELVFFDGEEAVKEFADPDTGPDGLVGSRHYAIDVRRSGRAKQFRFAIIWDMIGEKNVRLTMPSDSPRELAAGIIAAAEALQLQSVIGFHSTSILDDHVPLARLAKIPALDMIDMDYRPWHTAADTLDQLSPESLQKIGQITLWFLERALTK